MRAKEPTTNQDKHRRRVEQREKNARTSGAFSLSSIVNTKTGQHPATDNDRVTWVKETITALEAGKLAWVRPQGGSMRGRIESGQLVCISPVQPADVSVDDVVFVRWKGNYLLHVVIELDARGRLLIGNNLGKTNGWVSRNDVLGIVSEISS